MSEQLQLTLKNLKKILPREAYERVAAADIAYRLGGVEHNVGEWDKRTEESQFKNWVSKAGVEHAEKFGLTKLKAEYWECHSELVPQDFYAFRVARHHDQRNGRGRLSHFYFDARPHNWRGLALEAPLQCTELIIPKANIHLAGPVWAEGLHQLKLAYDKWRSHPDRERCRKRSLARRKFIKRIGNRLTASSLVLDFFRNQASEVSELTNSTANSFSVADKYRIGEFNQVNYDERVERLTFAEQTRGIEARLHLRLNLKKSYDRKVWRELSALIRKTGLLNNGKEVIGK